MEKNKISKPNQKWKILTGVFGGLATAGLAASVTVPFVVKKGGDTPIDPTTQEHSIAYKEATNWKIKGPEKAKKGDTIQFFVESKQNNAITEIPSKLNIGTLTKDLTESNGVYKTDQFIWPFVEDINIELITKAATNETVGVIFDIGAGTLIGGSLNDIKNKGCLLKDINTPSFSAPEGQEFVGWSIDGSTILDKETYRIGSDVSLIAIYQDKATPAITHKLVFVADKDEIVASGSRELTIDNGTTWAQVKENANFPTITKLGYSIGDYYVYDGTSSRLLSDIDAFTYESNTTIIINICWTTAEHTITFKNADTKTSFVSGETEVKLENIKSGTNFETISRPAVQGSVDAISGERYVPNGKWYIDEALQEEFKGSITEAKILYAGYDTKESTASYTYTVNFINAYGFEDDAKTKWTQTQTTEASYKWSDVKSSAPENKLKYPDGKTSSESEYMFVGWGMNDSDAIPEGSINVVAQWKVKEKKYYTIVFTSEDQVAWSGSQSFWFETTDTAKTKIGDLSYATPSKAGSTLVGWKVSSTYGGTEKTVEYKGTNWEANFKATKFSDLTDENTTIYCSPIFEADTTKHLVYILSNDTGKGTVSFTGDLSAISYQGTSTTFGSIKSKINTLGIGGYEFTQFRNGATGVAMKDTDTFSTDTIIFCDFLDSEGGFQGKDWSEVGTACATFEAIANPTIDNAKTLCAGCGVTFPLDGKDAKTTLEINLVGLTGTIKVNGLLHTVRILDAMHDTFNNGSTKAALTFEFAHFICDSSGYSLATFWNNTNNVTTANHNYLNSSIRKAISGEGDGTANWFEKDSAKFSTTYTGSVLSMLPTELSNILKNVDKKVKTYSISSSSWAETTYQDRLFLPTPIEMGYTQTQYGGTEGSTYSYYKNATTQNEAIRIKQQIMGSKNARTSSLSTTDGAYTSNKISRAGQNIGTTGCNYWISSPFTGNFNGAWIQRCDGFTTSDGIYWVACPVAPVFCI